MLDTKTGHVFFQDGRNGLKGIRQPGRLPDIRQIEIIEAHLHKKEKGK